MNEKWDWKGNPKATKEREVLQLLKIIRPTKKDIFYDLGCGHGNVCRWMSKKVKKSIGIESYRPYYLEAIRKTDFTKFPNVNFCFRNYEKIDLEDASILYCTMGFSIPFLKKIQKQVKLGTWLIIPEVPPPYPIKSKKYWPFQIFKTPYRRVKDPDDYARNCIDGKNVVLDDMYDWLEDESDFDELKSLKWNISHGEYNWKRLQK